MKPDNRLSRACFVSAMRLVAEENMADKGIELGSWLSDGLVKNATLQESSVRGGGWEGEGKPKNRELQGAIHSNSSPNPAKVRRSVTMMTGTDRTTAVVRQLGHEN